MRVPPKVRLYGFCALVALCPPGCCKNENVTPSALAVRQSSHTVTADKAFLTSATSTGKDISHKRSS